MSHDLIQSPGMIEFLTNPWIVIAIVLGVSSSLLFGRFNAARIQRDGDRWLAEERERLEAIIKTHNLTRKN